MHKFSQVPPLIKNYRDTVGALITLLEDFHVCSILFMWEQGRNFLKKTWSEALIIFNFHTSLLLAFLLHCGLSEKRKERWYLFGATKQHEFTARGSSIISHSLPFYNTYRVDEVSSSKFYTVTTRDCIESQFIIMYIWTARTYLPMPYLAQYT